MRLISYLTGAAGGPRIGVRVGHRVLDIEAASRVDGEPLPSTMKALLREGRGALSRVQALARKAQSDAGRFSAALCEERAIRFLPPVPDPGRFVCTREGAAPATLAASALLGHGAKMAVPATAQRVACEPALVFVIGRRAAGVKASDDAMDYAVGVTLLTDFPDGASSPAGPEIVTMDELADPYDLWLTCAVNGEERLRVSTGDLARGLPAILEQLSRAKPLEPGDMVSVGAAAAGGANGRDLALKPGDIVESGIEGITALRTTLVES
ncbi:MAG TPA: fumarylacetoacetate hydrolase family protein [Usitatibacter sp.]|nr:fumarylacetoacetate hydrolase family protein [Usitatibacter sp.]